MQDFLPVLVAVGINALAVGVGIIAVLYYREVSRDLSSGDGESSDYRQLIVDLVEAAEQIFQEAGQGGERFAWVVDRIEHLVPGLDIELVQALIEAAVYRLDRNGNDETPSHE